MKKIILLLTLITGLSDLAAAAKLNIITTTSDLASITSEIAGDRVTVSSIARGYQDPHFVEPKPSFLLQLRKADLLIAVGAELEIGWLPPLIDQSRNPRIRPGSSGYMEVAQGVEILDRPAGAINRSMGDVHPTGNPHFWLDPANAIRIAIQIQTRLVQLDSGGASVYASRLQSFKQRVNDANKRWTAALAPYRGARIVTYHNSWPSFARRYGLNVVGYVEPKPGVPPSPSHIFELIKQMKAAGVKAIIVEPYFDLKTPQSIATRTGAKVIVLYPSVGATPAVGDYFKLFDRNVSELVKVLK